MGKIQIHQPEIGQYRFGLRNKFSLGMIFIVFAITAATIIIGVYTYWNSITNYYNTAAYQMAEVAAGYFTEEELRYYADIASNIDTIDHAELEKVKQSEAYRRIQSLVDKLRKSMGANDIYVSVFDIDILKNFSQEKYEAKEWNPVYYIMDSYYKEDEQFELGGRGRIFPEFREDTVRAYETGVHTDRKIITNGEFGYILTASYPVVYNGETAAFIAVEIPMSTLQSDIVGFVVKVLLAAGIITAVMLTIGIVFIVRTMIQPIQAVALEAEGFVGDNTAISDRLDKIKTHDEIEVLAKSLLKLEIDVNQYIENLTKVTAEKERIGAELNVAAQIQADMLPRIFPAFPDRKEFDIYAAMTPAKEVGGDFYDFFLINDNHLAVVMADVSGKGVPAALFMVIAKTLIKNRAQMMTDNENYSPAEILSYVNEQLCEGNEAELFVTVWLGILQISTGKGIAANAGHEYPCIRRAGKGYELIKSRNSPAVAAMENMRFREHEFELSPGDSLYIYTDGVPEATNSSDELFGTDRMLEALNRNPDASPKELLYTVKNHMDAFVGEAPQFDDITMLCLNYFGEGGRFDE